MQDISLMVAFFSGIVSFFAPCVLPLLPAYISYVTGVSLKELVAENGIEKYKSQIISSSVWYLFGFSTLFVLLGTTAASLGVFVRTSSDSIQLIGGLFIMIFSLHFLGVIKIPLLSSGMHISLPGWIKKLGKARAFVVGIVFGTAWTPCVGAVLGAILTMAASSKTIYMGALLLFVYSMGIGLPFLLLSLYVLRHRKFLKVLQRYSKTVSLVGGMLLLLMGFLLFNNSIKLFGNFLTYDRLNQWFFKMAAKLGWRG